MCKIFVELPVPDDPSTWEYNGGVSAWTVPGGNGNDEDVVFACQDGDVEIGSDRFTPDEARQRAAALLAAADECDRIVER